MPEPKIRLLLADVDGTLVTPDKVLTERSVAAVAALGRAGVAFAITSGRPPRGMAMLISPLGLAEPLAAFNGGLIVAPDLTALEQRVLSADLVEPVVAQLEQARLSTWLYVGADWFVRDGDGPHVAREAATVQFAPTVVDDFSGLTHGVAKIVGVSDDPEVMDRATGEARSRFGHRATVAQSQPYYLDITHPEANKGHVVRYLSARLGIQADQVATIGDMPNDVLMFAHSGLSIAMGNASSEVQRSAHRVTTTNEDEGFANAVERFILAPDHPGAP